MWKGSVRHPADACGGCIEKFLVHVFLTQRQFPSTSTEVSYTAGHMHATASWPGGRIGVNLGEHVFEVMIYTLMGRAMLSAILHPRRSADDTSTPWDRSKLFVDPDPACFAHPHARHGEFHILDKVLYCEAPYHGLLDRVCAAPIGKLDMNRILLVVSVLTGPRSTEGVGLCAAMKPPTTGCSRSRSTGLSAWHMCDGICDGETKPLSCI